MNKLFLMTVFCLISNIACSMDDQEPDLSSYEPISLAQESKDNLLSFVKKQFVEAGTLPANSDLSLKAFTRDTGHLHPELGQRYTVAVVATWLRYNSVHSEPGYHVLVPQKHGTDVYSYMFKSGLDAAGVKLPK